MATSTTSVKQTAGSGSKALPALIGLTALGLLVQSLLAGVFLQGDERDGAALNAHGIGADVTTILALVTAVVAFRTFRHHTGVVVGTVVLFVLTAVETLLGHLINGSLSDVGGSSTEHSRATIIHVPLGMALLGLAVYLSLQAAQMLRTPSTPSTPERV